MLVYAPTLTSKHQYILGCLYKDRQEYPRNVSVSTSKHQRRKHINTCLYPYIKEEENTLTHAHMPR